MQIIAQWVWQSTVQNSQYIVNHSVRQFTFNNSNHKKCMQFWRLYIKFYVTVLMNFTFVDWQPFCCQVAVVRSSHSQMFLNIVVLKYLALFTWKHLSWSLFLIKLQACNFIRKRIKCYSVNIVKFFRTAFLKNTYGDSFCINPFMLNAEKYFKHFFKNTFKILQSYDFTKVTWKHLRWSSKLNG